MSYKSGLPTLLGLALLFLAIGARADNNEAFEDCATTTFEMRNNKAYLGADVIKFVKLQVGQGSIDCMSLCRASEECWSYNYDKTRKFCYLSSDEGTSLKSKRRQTWNSGYRVCVAHSDNTEWNNNEIDASTLAPTWTEIGIDVQYANAGEVKKRKLLQYYPDYPWTDGTITFDWDAPKGLADLNGAALPQYRIRCGPNNTDWHCDEAATEGWNSGYGLIDETSWSTSTTENFQALFALGVMKCYVEVYVDGIKTACSDAHVDIIDPFAAPMEWQPEFHQSFDWGDKRRKLQLSYTTQPHSYDNSIAVMIDNKWSTDRLYYYAFACTNDFTIDNCYDMFNRTFECMDYYNNYYLNDYQAEYCGISAIAYYPVTGPPERDYTLLHNMGFGPPSGVHRCFIGVFADFYDIGYGEFQFPICQHGNEQGTLVTVTGNNTYSDWSGIYGQFDMKPGANPFGKKP